MGSVCSLSLFKAKLCQNMEVLDKAPFFVSCEMPGVRKDWEFERPLGKVLYKSV